MQRKWHNIWLLLLLFSRSQSVQSLKGLLFLLFTLFYSPNVCGYMYDWFYHQISHHAPLWTCWCHSLTFSNTSTSSQSQLTTSYHHHHHNNHQNVQYRLGTHIHWRTAEAKFEVMYGGGASRCADMKKHCKWVNGCFWCWNILLFFFLNSGVAEVRRAVSQLKHSRSIFSRSTAV